MNIEEAKKKLLEPQKISLVEIIRKFKREGIENFIITLPEIVETLLTAYEKEKEKNKEYTMKINNLISQIESAIDFMKTDKLKIKVDMYQQKEEDLKLEIVHLKKLLKEE